MNLLPRPTLRLALCSGATVLVATLAACALGGGDAIEVTQGLVIRDAIIVNTRDGSLQPGRTLIIDAGKIQRIVANSTRVHTHGSAQVVQAQGQYVVPGYLDMHTHALTMPSQGPGPWPLFLANGVTGIREMGGNPALIARARQMNADSAAGKIDAPEILQVPGDIFFGAVNTPALARERVQQQKAQGASFIKITNANRDTALAMLAEAKAQGLGVAGHLVIALTAQESAQAGWRTVEHLGAGMGILLDCAAEAGAIRQAIAGGQGARPPFPPTFILSPMLYRAADAPLYQRVLGSYDETKCLGAAQAFASAGTWQVPTLLRLRTMLVSDDMRYRGDPNLAYVDKTSRALWEQLAQQYSTQVPAAAAHTFRQFFAAEQRLLMLLKAQGNKLLAGSDLGGIWIIPGFSLHQEFAELAAAGLSPLEVLQATTLNGAEFLGQTASMGTVDEGKHADLVLLEANPLSDVSHLARINGVVLKGRYFAKPALEQMKGRVAQAHRDQPLRHFSAVLDPHHVH